MKKQIMSRGTGKTTSLVYRSAETGLPILCCNKAKADYITSLADRYGLEIPKPIRVGDILGKRHIGEVLVDDLDHVFNSWLEIYDGEINCFTLSPADFVD